MVSSSFCVKKIIDIEFRSRKFVKNNHKKNQGYKHSFAEGYQLVVFFLFPVYFSQVLIKSDFDDIWIDLMSFRLILYLYNLYNYVLK